MIECVTGADEIEYDDPFRFGFGEGFGNTRGESVVIRVLDRSQVALDFETLGFDADALAVLRPILAAVLAIVGIRML